MPETGSMNQSYLTKCPECGSTFKINDQLLNAAGGKVRCGSCLTIFNAKERLFDKDGNPLQRGGHTDPHHKTPARQSVVERLGALQSTESSQYSTTHKHSGEDEEALLDSEEFIFEDNPEEDAEDERYQGPAKSRRKNGVLSDFDTDFLELDAKRDHDFVDAIETDLSPVAPGKETDESWAEKMLQEEMGGKGRQPSPPEPAEPKSSPKPVYHEQGAVPPPMKHADSTPASSSAPADPVPDTPDKPSRTPRPIPAEQFESLQFDPIAAVPSERTFLKQFLLISLVVLLVGGAVLEFAWLKRNEYSLYPSVRPFYEQVCQWLNCRLPDMRDVHAIKSQNLVVRSHPLVEGALLVDAVIVNKAPFEQPFPNIVMYFSDINNKVVIRRVFTPSEYLVNEAAGLDKMPVETPIHLSIEVKDPGPSAVNYSLAFE